MSSIYVHLPWCETKCPYCDFNSHQVNDQMSEKRYIDCLLSDLDQDLAKFGGLGFGSVFIGGGTPSLFSGESISRLLNGIRDRVEVKESCEITLEANPGSADAGRFEDYIKAGVNRISIGVQSFNNRLLKAIGRKHSAEEAENAIRIAKSVGFFNFNIDLMFGLPGAQKGDAISDLEHSIEFDPMHISWYQLTLEEKTAFARNPPDLPAHNDIYEEFEIGQSILQRNGFVQYEVSAYARNMIKSLHNMNYWEFGDYLGIGAGAHGKISSGSRIVRTEKISKPESYMRAIEFNGKSGIESEIDPSLVAGEYMLNALRLKDGFSLNDYLVKTYNTNLDRQFEQNIELACDKGLLSREDDWVRPTRLGYRFLNDLQVIFI